MKLILVFPHTRSDMYAGECPVFCSSDISIHSPMRTNFLPVESILYKSKAGSYRPVRAADGPITARCRFMKNAS